MMIVVLVVLLDIIKSNEQKTTLQVATLKHIILLDLRCDWYKTQGNCS